MYYQAVTFAELQQLVYKADAAPALSRPHHSITITHSHVGWKLWDSRLSQSSPSLVNIQM